MPQRNLRVKNELSAERREERLLWGAERKRRRTGRSGGGWIRDLHEVGEEALGGLGAPCFEWGELERSRLPRVSVSQLVAVEVLWSSR